MNCDRGRVCGRSPGEGNNMNIVLQFTAEEEAKALPILLRHSPGTILANRTYVVDNSATAALQDAGILFRKLTPHLNVSYLVGG
jgi:hypothetical protein